MAIIDFFDRGWRLGPGATAYVGEDRSWTFDEARKLSCRIAHGLRAAGLDRETKAGVLSPNDPRAWICVLGIWRAGLAWVPLNPTVPAADLQVILDRFDCEVLFYHRSTATTVAKLAPMLPKVKHYICLDEDPAADDVPSLADWTAGHPDTPPEVRYEMDDVAAIASTGGTTGLPKGVMNTHRSFSVVVAQFLLNVQYRADEPVVDLAALPMTHAAGVFSLAATARGGTVVVLPRAEPGAILDAIERYRVTEVFLAPTVAYRVMETPGIEERDFSSMRYLIYGAAPMSTDKLRRAIELFGPILTEAYGLAEAFAGISFMRPEEHLVDGRTAPDSRLASCGRPNPLINLEIRDDDGRPVPVGQTGEICVQGDILMKGYYKEPDKTAESLVDGWLHTGDVGHLDQDGYLFITDRKKDMIISGGMNVFPSEVEQVIWSHPAVQDCAVIGVPHDDWGEAVTAVVELNPGAQVDGSELIALCKDRLGSVRAPKRVDFVDSLPRSGNGKVLKRAVRERYWTAGARQI
ncbi:MULTISPECIES: class I adenylate-forming enzyme family protein [Streptomyces]|uniref:class I adenylate-forming enzyme family protein n=1 Tax=Streptomyces TaxID=1883 RepID=UPI00081BBDBC|nr:MULTISPECIES: AMP-binding protein [unclassified Streptomyces]MYQ53803.1 AMP-binding protein [Streptomyces sp. SID4941]SCE12440.1 Acyl-CoA synthetase (AMP-forming)/AMP-acid ligase II [Streptomyces sp. PalvLS-984]SDB88952.1 Acyl-CoA synthetase (AMP-forming)/AMP-acid ligase II [Streptomyces sp. AmelKG-A3]